ncbi:MAG TPA: TIR domain-containing protein, partial [Aggregatilineales bacterium]|nr:TIR domain-containing protein [Aggregatilineales bacterium]
MPTMTNSVFISYRRHVSAFIARAVFLDLQAHGIDTFMDVESINSGAFDTIILNQIAARPYFLVILTPGTLDRCLDPGDWLLREIQHAVTLDRVIVPLVTPYFSFGDCAKFLPEPLKTDLPRQNALSLPHDYFEAAMDKLRTRFLVPIDRPSVPAPAADLVHVQQTIRRISDEPPITGAQFDAQDYLERGLKRMGDGEFAGAIRDFTAAIELNPDHAETYYQRGLAHDRTGDRIGAAVDYHRALA